MSRAVLSSLIKGIRLHYPNDKTLEANCVTGRLTITSKAGDVRHEDQSNKSGYLTMLGDLYGFKTVERIVFQLETKAFEIHGTDESGNVKTITE